MEAYLLIAFLGTAITSCAFGVEPPVSAPPGNTIPLWKSASIQGAGPIAIDATSIYVQDFQKRTLHALDKRTGIERWRVALPTSSFNWGMQVSQGVVVAASNDLSALDAASGALIWRLGASQEVGTLAFSTNEMLVFPTVYRGTGLAKAVDLFTGAIQWETSIIPDTVVVAPTVDQVRVREPRVSSGIVATSFVWWKGSAQPKGGVAVLDAENGALRWTTMLPVVNPQASTFPTRAAMANGSVAVASGEGRVYLFDAVSGALRWTGPPDDRGTPGSPQPVILDDRPLTIVGQSVLVASTTAYVTAFDLQSGTLRWRQNTKRSAITSLEPFGNGKVIAMQLGGEITILDIATGSIAWQWIPRAQDEWITGVAFAGDTLFANFVTGGVAAFRVP